MENPFEALNKEFVETSEKLSKSFKMLSEVESVDIATAEKHLVWQEDNMKLYRYQNDNITCKVPVLIVYALVNTYQMMDLQPDRSLIRKLLSQGLDVYLIDWGQVNSAQRYLSLNDYINGYVDNSVDFIRKAHSIPKVNLLGVCQGGTFSLIYSALHPEKVKNLSTLVTPVDFSVNDGLLFRWSKYLDVDKIVDGHGGVIPGKFLDSAFDMLKPLGKTRKYNGIANVFDDNAKLMNFLRMEKWVSDTPNLAGECYRQFIKDLYQNNKLIKGELELDGEKVNLKNVTMPVITIYAAEDHIVPPSATKPINDYIGSEDKQLYEFPGGHIGVFVGARSQKELSPVLAEWYKSRS
ncbi:MAG: class III poly(R)-hydroxyalkanoic acid synthase subunit PhaC [Bacteroidetes bacterium]|nr:MAG: class III poly(R)-hydroxyalkanoic acid synthase subunit PhaC [Bacteroidota bacterium]